jgi:hypothetical protein
MVLGSIIGVVLFLAMAAGALTALKGARRRFLRELGPQAEEGLRRITAGFFDAAPATSCDREGRARLEGTRGGESIAIEAVFTSAASGRYMRTGYKTGISAEVSVVVGLRGATPAFSFETTSRARDESVFARAWRVVAADDELFDDELRAELMRLVDDVRSVRSVTVDREGLRITWLDDAGVVAGILRDADATAFWEKGQSERIATVTAAAMRVRKKILETLERREHAHVRVDAYRDEAPLSEDAESENARSMSR